MPHLICYVIPVVGIMPIVLLYMRAHRPIPFRTLTPEKIREILTRTELQTNGAGAFFNREIGCDRSFTPEGQKLSFRATGFRGKLTAEFDPDGRLLRWNNGSKKYPRELNHLRKTYFHDVWLWESILGTIQNIEPLNNDNIHDGGTRVA